MLVIMLVVLQMVMQEQLATFVHVSEMLINQHGACRRASVREEVEKFKLFWG